MPDTEEIDPNTPEALEEIKEELLALAAIIQPRTAQAPPFSALAVSIDLRRRKISWKLGV